MKSYFEPDPRWIAFGMKTEEVYLDTMLVKGLFHDKVPKDVQDAFEVVEYLTAFAYYRWEIYDEAVIKAFRILEMAVKLKAKEIELPLIYLDRRGEERDKSFSRLIKEMYADVHHESLKIQLDRARELRNARMHADTNMFMGGIGNTTGNLRLFANVLNQLFLDDEDLRKQYAERERIRPLLEALINRPLVLEKDQERILIKGFWDFRIVKEVFFLVCDHVLVDAYKDLCEHRYTPPIVLALKAYEISDQGLCGTSLSGGSINIVLTGKEENRKMMDAYIADITRLSEMDKFLFNKHFTDQAPWDISFWEYQYQGKIYKSTEVDQLENNS